MVSESNCYEQARKRGRALGITLFAVAVTAVTAWWTVEIVQQVWPKTPAPDASGTSTICEQGLAELLRAVENAKRVAVQAGESGLDPVERFRAGLGPLWITRQRVRANCQFNSQWLEALEQIETLAYAEERALRYEASQVYPERLRVRAVAAKIRGNQ